MRSHPREISITDSDRKAAALLVEMGRVRYPSDFGDMLVRRGIIRSEPGMRYRRQGLALMAGKALARLQRLRLASYGWPGYVATDDAVRLAEESGQGAE